MSKAQPIITYCKRMAHLKSEGNWYDYEAGPITDPDKIARLNVERDERIGRELAAEEAAEERIRIANETGRIKFSSGRYIEPMSGIVGISPDFSIYEGAEGVIDARGVDGWREPDLELKDLTELADVMIDRWERFKASLEDAQKIS